MADLRDISVLVAHGNGRNAFLLKRLLNDMNFSTVDTVSDGYGALFTLKRKRFDLLLADSALPRLPGLTLVSHLRGVPRYTMPRVLLLLAETAQGKDLPALPPEVRGVLNQPVSAKELQQMLQQLFDIRIV